MMTNKATKKIVAGLLAVIGLDLALLLDRYMRYKVPIGWDTPLYVYMVRLIDSKGIYVFFQETYYPHFYSLFEFLIFRLLIHDAFLIERIVPITLNLLIVLLSALITFKLFQEPRLSLLAAFFTGTSVNLIRMTADLHRNLLGYAVALSSLLLAYELYKQPSLKHYVMLLISFLLLVTVHIETAILFLLMILIFEGLAAKTWKLEKRKKVLFLSSLFIPLIVLLFFFYPYSVMFLIHSISVIGWHMLEMPTLRMEDIIYFLQLLGGATIPFAVIGMFECAKLAKNKDPKGLLMATYCFTPLILAPFLLGLGERALLLFPHGIVAALGFSSIYHYSSRLTNINVGRYSFRNGKRFRTILAAIALTLVLTLNIYIASVSARQWLITFIDEETYEDLQWLCAQEMSKPPVVVMQFPDNPWADLTLRLYRNWVKAVIGDNYVYVGKLYGLLHGYRTIFSHESLERFSVETWNELMQEGVLDSLHDYPIIILSGFYRSSLTPYEKAILKEVRQGTYMLKDNYVNYSRDLFSIRLIPYVDFYAGYKWYPIERDWATTGFVLETYDETPEERFYVSYKVLLFSNINYALKVRLLDVASSFAAVEIVFDNNAIYKISYNGTGQIMEITVLLGEVDTGFHDLMLRIMDLSHAHMLSLDYIDIIPIR